MVIKLLPLRSLHLQQYTVHRRLGTLVGIHRIRISNSRHTIRNLVTTLMHSLRHLRSATPFLFLDKLRLELDAQQRMATTLRNRR